MSLVLGVLVFGLAVVTLVGGGCDSSVELPGASVSGPYTHENISIFFIHANKAATPDKMMTLDEALEAGKIEVIETGSVGELAVENLSDEPVFIQSGDIVKGGRQDRTLEYDLVVRPQSGRVPIKSFCVEQGRWSRRGSEAADIFESSKSVLFCKDLKLAVKSKSSQSDVWREVAEVQSDLTRVLGGTVNDAVSPTSLQLALENDSLETRISEGEEELTGILNKLDNVTGFAFAINGELNSADLYGSPELFAKMWPKLIRAALTEAVASASEQGADRVITANDVEEWLAAAKKGTSSVQEPGNQMHLKVTESDKNLMFESKLASDSSEFIHRNVIKK